LSSAKGVSIEWVGAGTTKASSTSRSCSLKETYEERIFHAVMQRDQWFQVLIGSKRNELGRADDDETAMQPGDIDEGTTDIGEDVGKLSSEEKAAVMMDLRPATN